MLLQVMHKQQMELIHYGMIMVIIPLLLIITLIQMVLVLWGRLVTLTDSDTEEPFLHTFFYKRLKTMVIHGLRMMVTKTLVMATLMMKL